MTEENQPAILPVPSAAPEKLRGETPEELGEGKFKKRDKVEDDEDQEGFPFIPEKGQLAVVAAIGAAFGFLLFIRYCVFIGYFPQLEVKDLTVLLPALAIVGLLIAFAMFLMAVSGSLMLNRMVQHYISSMTSDDVKSPEEGSHDNNIITANVLAYGFHFVLSFALLGLFWLANHIRSDSGYLPYLAYGIFGVIIIAGIVTAYMLAKERTSILYSEQKHPQVKLGTNSPEVVAITDLPKVSIGNVPEKTMLKSEHTTPSVVTPRSTRLFAKSTKIESDFISLWIAYIVSINANLSLLCLAGLFWTNGGEEPKDIGPLFICCLGSIICSAVSGGASRPKLQLMALAGQLILVGGLVFIPPSASVACFSMLGLGGYPNYRIEVTKAGKEVAEASGFKTRQITDDLFEIKDAYNDMHLGDYYVISDKPASTPNRITLALESKDVRGAGIDRESVQGQSNEYVIFLDQDKATLVGVIFDNVVIVLNKPGTQEVLELKSILSDPVKLIFKLKKPVSSINGKLFQNAAPFILADQLGPIRLPDLSLGLNAVSIFLSTNADRIDVR